MAKLLIDNGADIEAKDESGDTPLYSAISAKKNQKEILNLLYEKGAKIDIRNEYNSTPIIQAGFLGNSVAVEWLIEKNIDLNALDKNKYTALHDAASYGHYKTVSILLENGADVNIVSETNETPLDRALRPREWKYASPWGKRKAARIIRKYGGKRAEELKAER